MNGQQPVEVIAKMLAGEHMSNDPGIVRVYWAEHPTEVRLVEVSKSVEDRGEVLPFRFTADPPEVPYESVVILLSPGDWERVAANELDVPEGFEHLEPIAEAAGADGA